MAHRRLHERATTEHPLDPRRSASGVIAVDQRSEREQQQVLGQRKAERKLPGWRRCAAADDVEGEAEGGAVRRVECHAGERPGPRARDELPEQCNVRVVIREHRSVELLGGSPGKGCRSSGGSRAGAAHPATVPAVTVAAVPEGDTIHRAAQRLQVLVGERIAAESPHPRARAERVAERVDGRVLESVAAHGKNLILRFEGGVVLRSHLRVSGRWTVARAGGRRAGTPWLVLRGERAEGVLWNGPVLELHTRGLARLGPDILQRPPRIDAMLARMRTADQTLWFGETLLDQSLVAGIGNMWLAETLWQVELSPWRRLHDVSEPHRRRALEAAAELMRASVDGTRRGGHQVYRRVGRPCPRCRTRIRSWGQCDDNRMTYWCPGCQAGDDPPRA
jgi:endonuclease VIII